VRIAACGNEGNDVANWPATLDEFVGVAATVSPSRLAAFSSRGVELAAPGVELLSLAGVVDDGLVFEKRSGTSLAAGVLTAVSALALGADLSLNEPRLRSLLVTTGKPLTNDPSIVALDAPTLAARLSPSAA
jgi:subtilisin family serine protease